MNIVCLVEQEIRLTTNRSFPILATNQVLITLRFFPTGSFLQVVEDAIAGPTNLLFPGLFIEQQ